MSFMHMDATTAAAAAGYEVSLSGDNIFGSGSTSYQWGWRLLTTGYLERNQNGFFTNVNTGSDWITPRTGFTPADYEVRAEIISGSGFCSFAASEIGNAVTGGGWYSLAIDRRYWWSMVTPFNNEFCDQDVRMEIRDVTNPSNNIKTSVIDATPIMDDGVFTYFIEVGLE